MHIRHAHGEDEEGQELFGGYRALTGVSRAGELLGEPV